MAILLSEVIADNGAPLLSGQVRDVAPRELTFKFDAAVDPATLFGIQVQRSVDGIFDNGNDVFVDPQRSPLGAFPNGFVGIGDRPSDVALRFGQPLQDDFYRVTIFGAGLDPIRDTTGTPFNNGVNQIIDFRLALGAQVLGVVPQPITRDSFGSLQQARNTIEVFFNDDDLDTLTANDPSFYRLIYTNTTATNTDDVIYLPSTVAYDPVLDKATLTFSSDLDQLGSGTGTFRLRIGSNEGLASQGATEVPVAINTGLDAGSSYATAQNLTPGPGLGRGGLIVSGNIEPQNYDLTLPGGNEEPGHRQISAENHLTGLADTVNGITTIYYDFRRDFGVDPLGNPLINVIQDSPAQIQRAREALEFYSNFLGVQFVETNPAPGTPSIGFTIATGDMRVVSPTADAASGDGVTGIAGTPNTPSIGGVPVPVHSIALAVMDSSESALWGASEFGGNWFREAMREIGQLLGYGLATEQPNLTLNRGDLLFIAPGGGNTAEPVFPGDHDIVHGQYLYRPESNDIDLYRFDVTTNGTFRGESIAERLPTSSLLDTVITLFGDVRELVVPAAGGAALADGQSFVLSDGVHTVTFEFDDVNLAGVQAGNRPIVFRTADTADQIAAAISKAIADTPSLGISPTAHFNRIKLRGATNADVTSAGLLGLEFAREMIASNDDYYSEDSFMELHLSPGTYYVGVTARGNSQYDPTIADSGFGGTSQGDYQLRVNFTPDVATTLVDFDGTALDGDVDGVPGGNFNFWFQVGDDNNSIYVDKSFTGAELGTLANPFNDIPSAFAAATARPGAEIVRVVGNGGTDGDLTTLGDNLPYAVGFNTNGTALSDGITLNVPGRGTDPNGGVTMMIDAGAIFKMRLANIAVGSSAQNLDRSLSHLQVLGIPGQPVTFTSALDETIGVDVTPVPSVPAGGNWGGIVFRNNLDYAENRTVLEQQGIFLNYVNGADIRYGGGDVTVNSILQRFTPIHMVESRPTISNNKITRSADAAMSADPRSFADTRFVGADFTGDYERIGPHIRRNTLAERLSNGSVAQNSVNGLFVRIRTQVVAGQTNVLDLVDRDSRWDDADIPHILAENLIIQGTPEGAALTGSNVVVTSGLSAEESVPGNPTNDTIATAVNTTLPVVPAGQYRVFRDTGVIGDNPTLIANPDPDRDVDFFRFDLAAGSRVTINVNTVQFPLAPEFNFDSNLRLFDSNGVELAFSDSRAAGAENSFGETIDPYIDFVAKTSGTYYVAVAGAGNRAYNPNTAASGATTGVFSTGTYDIEIAVSTTAANLDSRLRIDPGLLVKAAGSRIETQIGANLIIEGEQERRIVFTSLRDDRYGGGGTFDTNADQASTTTGPGDWGGIFLGHLSQGSLDHVLVTFAGGLTRIEGTSDRFNALEIHQAEARVTNSVFENNGTGLATTLRNGRAENSAATIFVRGAQPILANNIIRNGLGAAISIDPNSMEWQPNADWGRTTGWAQSLDELAGNQGPLVRGNRYAGNAANAMEIRGGTLTTQTVWDDTDIVHLVRNEIVVPNHHVYSGLRLQSSPTESLVVKLAGANAGFTAEGLPLDINDRIGGTIQISGTPGHQVVLTSLSDDSPGFGVGLTPDGLPQTDTNNNGPSTGTAGDWRSVRLEETSNDRNVEATYEEEPAQINSVDLNGTPLTAQVVGQLAADLKSGDENRRLGFEVRGVLAFDTPGDVDVYSFVAQAGSEVWIDIDRTSASLDTVIELVDADGNTIARSDDSHLEQQNPALLAGLVPGNLARLLERDTFHGQDVYTTNPRDAGMRLVLPGAGGVLQAYFVRVYSKNSVEAGNPTPPPYQLGAGDTSGHYQFQIRLQEEDEVPGSTVRYSDIRFPTTGLEVLGLPAHSPLVGDIGEQPNDVGNENIGGALNIGNVLQSDLGSMSIAGALATATDVDWYTFTVDYDEIDFEPGLRTVSLAFDIDYADGIGRPDTVISVFDSAGRLVMVARDSDVLDDQPGPTAALGTSDLTRGTFGKLDPYIGPQQFPAGQTSAPLTSQQYFVAVSSNAQLPTALNLTFQSAAGSPTLRLEPALGVQRIAEDHIGFNGHSSGQGSTIISQVDPVTPSLFDIEDSISLQANIKPFTLADVPLFVSSSFDVFTVNANTGATENFYNNSLPGFNETVEDIDFRSDGRLFAYASAVAGNNQDNAGRLIEINTQTGAVGFNMTDSIPDMVLNTSQVDALTIRRTGQDAAGVPLYDFMFFSVRDPSFTTPSSHLFSANANGDADVTGAGAGNRGRIGNIMVNTPGDIGVTTGLALSGTSNFSLFGVTDQGHFISISTFGGGGGGGLATVLLTIPGMEFQGLTQGPQNLDFNQDGVYGDLANAFFAITTNGELVCIDQDPLTGVWQQRAVFDANNDGVLESVLQTNAFSPTGLAFSPVDFNLWHPTMNRRDDVGHGVNATFDNDRFEPQTVLRNVGPTLRAQTESSGGASMYFGLEQWVQAPNPNDYFTYTYQTAPGVPFFGGNSQYGILSTSAHRDLMVSTGAAGDNYNLPGGAKGSLQTNAFSLEGYAATDKPTLYFNYFLDTENVNSTTVFMRDSARVQISADGGVTWNMLATNNGGGTGVSTDPFRSSGSELPFFSSASSNVDSNPATLDPRQRIQELFDNTGGWRQARVDLGEFAGQSNLLIRFDFSTAGSMNEGIPGDEHARYFHEDRFQDNTNEGFYVDDVIIGFAERGELVTNSAANSAAFSPVPLNPNGAAPQQILTGDYQLEIRAATEYGANIFVDASPIISGPSLAYPEGFVMDTNDRLTEGFTILAPQPDRFLATQRQINNLFAPNVLNFRFDNVDLPTGVGALTLTATGDLAAANEFLSINLEGIVAQNVFVVGGQAFAPVTVTIPLSLSQLQLLTADGVINLTVTPSASVENVGLTTLDATLAYGAGSTAPEGEIFTIGDGLATVTFEFDSAGGVRPGNIPVPYTRTQSAATIAATMVSVINTSILETTATATPTSNRVNLNRAASLTTSSTFDLEVVLNASTVRENGPATQARVVRGGPTTNGVLVQIAAIDPVTGLPSDEIVLNGSGSPTSTIFIPSGASQSPLFSVAARDDASIDLTQTAIIVATLVNFNPVSAPIDIQDDEVGLLTITTDVPAIAENAGANAAVGTVSLSAPAEKDVIVSLLTSDTTEATTPAFVIIPAGQLSATFPIDAVPDFVADGAKQVKITASAVGLITGQATINVADLGNVIPFLPFVRPNTNASQSAINDFEPTIMVNPLNPNNLFMAASQSSGTGLRAAVSFDAGVTWTPRAFATGADGLVRAADDASGGFDQFGNLYVSYLGFQQNEVVVARSVDGGLTFTQLAILDTFAFGGKPQLSVGPTSVWVAWDDGLQISAAGATSLGLGITGAFSVPQQTTGSLFPPMGSLVVGPTGQVAVAYQESGSSNGPTNIIVHVDPDGLGPLGFAAPVTVTSTNVGPFDSIPQQQFNGIDAGISLAWDRSSGAFANRLYLVYTDEQPQESDDTDIQMRFSDDGGQTWSLPIRVNDDLTTNGQIFPRIAVDQTTGDIAVTWYDSRNDSGLLGPGDLNGFPNDDVQVFGTFSIDGGTSFFPNFQISEGTTNVSNGFSFDQLGSYHGLDFLAGTIYTAWTDNSGTAGNDFGLPNTEIYTAGTTLAPLLGAVVVDIATDAINESGANSTTAIVTRTGDTSQPLTVSLNVLNRAELLNIDEVQTLTSTALAGTFTLTFEGQTTGALNFNITAPALRTALESLNNIAVGDVSVTGGPIDTAPIVVTFLNNLGGSNRGLITINNAGLIGGTASAAATIEGVGVPSTITIPAGQSTSSPIDLVALDDLFSNAGQTVLIVPNALGYDPSSDNVLVQDNDLPQLTLAIDPPGQFANGDGLAAILATITRNTPPTDDLVVTITSHDQSELRVPVTVTIPAGQVSVTFPIDAFLEFGLDGTTSVQVTASAAGFISASDTLDVLESPSFEEFDRFGDGNIIRPQGNLIIENNRINNASTFAIVVDASARDGNRPHIGAVRNTRELNIERWVPGVVVENNVLTFNGAGGIQFSGDDNANGVPLAAIPFGRIVNNTIFGSTVAPTGVGIDIRDNASPTVLNNIVSQFVTGVSISADSDSTVLGGTLYKQNTTHAATPGSIGLGSFDLNLDLLSPLIPLFRNPANGDFTLVEGSLAIDSSIDSLTDRPELLAVTQPLGISQSPILAPELDLRGLLRVDNPLVASPPGLGLNVFKDRGALERLEPVTIGVSDLTVQEGDAGQTPAVFTVSLSEVLSLQFSVTVSSFAGTAALGTDFAATSTTLTFLPGESTQLVTLNVFGDVMDEDDETFFLALSSPTAGAVITDFQGQATIIDDDGPPSLSINDQSVFEGDAGQVNVVLTLTLSAASGRTVTVDYSTANGTAIASSDYFPSSGTVTFTPGIATAALTMQTQGDKNIEADETFFLNIANPINATLGDSQGVITIRDDDASVSVSDVTVLEGNGGPVNAVFNVTLSKAASSPVTMQFATTNGTAVGGIDYTSTSGILSFAPLETVKAVTVQVQGDTLDEANETFNVVLLNLQNVVGQDTIGQGTITDDDASPTVAITPAVTVDEGDAGSTVAAFIVTLSAPSGQQVLVPFSTANGTATAGNDYTAVSQTLTFLTGITQQTLLVSVLGDTTAETNETFQVNLLTPSGATIAAGQGVGIGTIVDDEPRMTINDVTLTEADAGTQLAVFTVSLTRSSPSQISVAFSTSNGTAAAGSDYDATQGTLTFASGEVQKSITVQVRNDAIREGDEQFFVNLTNVSAGAQLSDNQGVGFIIDNDPQPTISIQDAQQNEGNGPGSTPMPFIVRLSSASGLPVTVRYATANGTAQAGSDFGTAVGSLTFAPGITQQTINVSIVGNTIAEADETFFVNLSSATNALIQDGQAQGTIIDDEALLSISDALVTESNGAQAVFDLTLSKIVGGNVVVSYSTADGSAVAGQDYIPANGAITFTSGETRKSITVAVIGDQVNEGTEAFFINLSGLTGATLSDAQGIATILDDDPPPVLFIDSITVAEGNSGISNGALTVSLSAPLNRQVTVNFASSNGSAVAGVDYIPTGGTLVFNPGETIKQIGVQIVGDTQPEPIETFQVILSGATNALVSGATGVVTITDNDPAPFLVTGAGEGGGPHVRVFDPFTGAERFGFMAYDPRFTGGVRVATADINDDGQTDIITVPGPGGGPHVRVFDGRTLGEIAGFFAFDGSVTGGLTVATGDVNLDGRADIIVGTEGGSGAAVRVFNGANFSILNTFNFPANTAFQGGVHVAAGDVDGDGRSDVIVANGPGNTPRVLVLNAQTGATIRDFFAYTPNFGGGVYVAAGDVDGDGRADLITGPGAGGGPHLRAFSGATGNIITEFFVYNSNFTGGVRVATVDANGDGRLDIVTAAGPGGGPHVRVFDVPSRGEIRGFFAYSAAFTGGVFAAGSKPMGSGGSPLMADGGDMGASEGANLTETQLQPVVRSAIDRLRASGVDPRALDRLSSIEVRVADLPAGYLGQAFSTAVYIDSNAAGHGWFVDATPGTDDEFLNGIATGLAARRMDLLTTVLHELGHTLGLYDLDGDGHEDDVMSGLLAAGTRRTEFSAIDSIFGEDEWN